MFFPLMYSFFLLFASLSIYTENMFLAAIGAGLGAAVTFAVCFVVHVKKQKWVYFLVVALGFGTASVLLSTEGFDLAHFFFAFGGGGASRVMFAVFLCTVGFALVSCVYYASMVRFRRWMLVVIASIPVVLCSNAVGVLSVGMVAGMFGSLFAVFITAKGRTSAHAVKQKNMPDSLPNTPKSNQEEHRGQSFSIAFELGILGVTVVFSAATVFGIARENISFLNSIVSRQEQAGLISDVLGQQLFDFSGTSGLNRGNYSRHPRTLFEVESNEQTVYLRSEVFDRWDGVQWVRDANPSSEPLRGAPVEPPHDGDFVTVTPKRFVGFTLPHPLGGEMRNLSSVYTSRLYRTNADEIYTKSINEALRERTYNFQTDIVLLPEVRQSADDVISSALQSVATDTTAGCNTAEEKIAALLQYYADNGFVYSIDYVPPPDKETLDDFFFETKTGSCTDYATSLCLLCRGAGLTARYVTGFLAQSETPSDLGYTATVTQNDAHAYVEVFLPDKGWTIADATGVVPEIPPAETALARNLGFVAAGLTVLLGLGWGCLRWRKYRRHKRAVFDCDPREGVVLCYQLLLARCTLPSAAISPQTAAEWGSDARQLVCIYEKAAFSAETVSPDDRERAWTLWRRCRVPRKSVLSDAIK